jgi:hypothetical protein
MTLKILNSILILVAVFMGIKQGWAMLMGKHFKTYFKFQINPAGKIYRLDIGQADY